MLPKIALINITEDTFIILKTWEIPRVLGTPCQKWGQIPNICISHQKITISHSLVSFSTGSELRGERDEIN